MNFFKSAAILFILAVSAFFRLFGMRACRFHPSCSVYAAEAFKVFGFWRACGVSLARLSKCHPLHAGGHDPLPESSST